MNDTVLKRSGPLFGAMVPIAVNFLGPTFGIDLFNQPDPVADLRGDITDALAQLATDMAAHTDQLIDQKLLENNATILTNRMNARRGWFYDTYPGLRAEDFDLAIESRLIARAFEVKGKADDIEVDIEGYFPTLDPTHTAAPTEHDVKAFHFAMDVVKLATTEWLIMAAEAALMDAYATPTRNCDNVADQVATSVNAATAKLTRAVDAIVAFGLANPQRRNDYSRLGTPLTNGATDREFEFDVRHFSNDISHQLEFFGNLVEDTRAKCLRLRDPQDSFSDHFVANTAAPPPPTPAP